MLICQRQANAFSPHTLSTMRITFGFLAILLFNLNALSQGQVLNAHAHNDYEHERPLFLALAHGFMSVEVDIHVIADKIYVAHDHPSSLTSTPKLEQLYLKPLKSHIDKNDGCVYPNYHGFFYLMIDIKTAAEHSYPVLMDLLDNYSSIISIVKGKSEEANKPVKVLLSGNRPVELLMSDELKYAGIDGRPHELDERYPNYFMPLISENYQAYLSWNGTGTPDDEELENLINMIDAAHRQNKKVRLWAAPDNPAAWELLISLGIDLINTDRIKEFKEFVDNRKR